MEEFIKLIKQEMKLKNINAVKLSKKLGFSAPYVYDLLNRNRRLNETIITKLCNEFNINIIFQLKNTKEETNEAANIN